MRKLVGLLPFMDSDEIKELAVQIINEEVEGVKLVILFPFMNKTDIDEVVELLLEKGDSKQLNRALPFLSKQSVERIYEQVQEGTLTGIREELLFPFLGKKLRKNIFESIIKEAKQKAKDGNHEDHDHDHDDEDVKIIVKENVKDVMKEVKEALKGLKDEVEEEKE